VVKTILAPAPPGLFFATRFFQIFIKFFGGAVFLYSIGFPDFLKLDLRVQNSVHTMTARLGSIGVVGVWWGQAVQDSGLSRGFGNTLCYNRCIDWGNSFDSFASPISEAFLFGVFNHD
jgi:hypothetical protein